MMCNRMIILYLTLSLIQISLMQRTFASFFPKAKLPMARKSLSE